VETYRMAQKSIDDAWSRAALQELERDHSRNVELLSQKIQSLGGEVPEGSGPWGAWAKAVTGTSTMFGDRASFKILKEGEEHGIKEYQDAIAESGIDSDVKQLLTELIPKQSQHIARLDQCMQRLD